MLVKIPENILRAIPKHLGSLARKRLRELLNDLAEHYSERGIVATRGLLKGKQVVDILLDTAGGDVKLMVGYVVLENAAELHVHAIYDRREGTYWSDPA